jgi:hypothetical protein
MKTKITLIILMILPTLVHAQISRYDRAVVAQYTPLTPEQAMLIGLAKARAAEERDRINKANFEFYQNLAYQSINNGDKSAFIYYSDKALATGWYNSKLYYDRGLVYYYDLGEKRKGKKELKKAAKYGYYQAYAALQKMKNSKK